MPGFFFVLFLSCPIQGTGTWSTYLPLEAYWRFVSIGTLRCSVKCCVMYKTTSCEVFVVLQEWTLKERIRFPGEAGAFLSALKSVRTVLQLAPTVQTHAITLSGYRPYNKQPSLYIVVFQHEGHRHGSFTYWLEVMLRLIVLLLHYLMIMYHEIKPCGSTVVVQRSWQKCLCKHEQPRAKWVVI